MDLNNLLAALIVLGVTVVPYAVGVYVAQALRMKDHGWKLGVIFAALASGLAIVTPAMLPRERAAAIVNREAQPDAPSAQPRDDRWQIRYGIDLAGGVILVYEIDQEATELAVQEGGEEARARARDIVPLLSRRIDPSGTSEIAVREYGEQQIEIIIPRADRDEVERVKRRITTSGVLEFRIVANQLDRKHDDLIRLAQEQARDADPARRRSRAVYARGDVPGRDRPAAQWVRVAMTERPVDGRKRFREHPIGGEQLRNLARDSATGQLLTFTAEDAATFGVDPELLAERLAAFREGKLSVEEYVQDVLGVETVELLVATNDGQNVTGSDLRHSRIGIDEQGRPSVNFTMTGEGSGKFATLTAMNVDKTDIANGLYRHLAIILDNELLTAPRLQSMISSNGQITGRFSQEEVSFYVQILNAGRLPAVLNPNPINENAISPLLGETTIRKGRVAIAVSIVAVLVFMLVYYRLSGVIACFCLLLNLVLILGFMILFRATLSLPGMAGLVLTVGMSVDANVLIYERIREELARGSALRLAIRNGFSRATTTIVDANLTTLITAIVLYGIGTEQIKGFAVTLILGILMSMFTAIFVARVLFDIAERQRWIAKLQMMRLFGATHFDFMGRSGAAIAASLLLIVLGLVGVTMRGADIFDIDFRGGSSADAILKTSKSDVEVRRLAEQELTRIYNELLDERLAELDPQAPNFAARQQEMESWRRPKLNVSVSELTGSTDKEGRPRPRGTVWKIDTSIPESDLLQVSLARLFRGTDGVTELETHSLTVSDVRPIAAPIRTPVPPAVEEPAAPLTPATPSAPRPDIGPAPSETPLPSTPAAPSPAPEPAPEPTPNPEPSATPTPEPAPEPAPAPTPEPAPEPAPAEAPEPTVEPAGDNPRSAPAKPPAPPVEATDAEANAPEAPTADDARRVRAPAQHVLWAALWSPWSPTVLLWQDEPAAPAESPAAEPAPAEPAPAEPAPAEPAVEPAPTAAEPDSAAPAAESTPGETADDASSEEEPASQQTAATLEFDHDVNANTVREELLEAARRAGFESPAINLPDWDQISNQTARKWRVVLGLPAADAQRVLDRLERDITETPVFLAVSKIGGKVAGDTRNQAVGALLASLVGIVAYIWLRFQKVVYGLAAVVALVHDVSITVGAIALSAYVAPGLGFLLVEDFRISLPIVAALLTIIGYSLNDTIVVFDRIREVKGKSPVLTGEMINLSINQTLSRTALTSFTTLLVVGILYAIGGEGVHGFAFALLVGVVVGTYSSIFIASPILLWMTGAPARKQAA